MRLRLELDWVRHVDGRGWNGKLGTMMVDNGRDLQEYIFLGGHVFGVVGACRKGVEEELQGKISARIEAENEEIVLDARMLGEHPVGIGDNRLHLVDVAVTQV